MFITRPTAAAAGAKDDDNDDNDDDKKKYLEALEATKEKGSRNHRINQKQK